MEWTLAIREAIRYMEDHLLENISADDVAAAVHISGFYFQKGFHLMSGYTIGEYIRNRRLYLAALDLLAGEEKVIDIALKYGYDTPESFSKAFRRFHGMTPARVKQERGGIKPFLPLRITISVKGGSEMDYTIETMDAFRVIGAHRRFRFDNSYEMIPKYWDEFLAGKMARICEELNGKGNVGKYGICVDNVSAEEFEYWIAGDFDGGEVPEGLDVWEVPAQTWAKFDCTGALQSVNTRIFKEWLPGNPDWEFAAPFNLELYFQDDLHTEIWIPVKKRKASDKIKQK